MKKNHIKLGIRVLICFFKKVANSNFGLSLVYRTAIIKKMMIVGLRQANSVRKFKMVLG